MKNCTGKWWKTENTVNKYKTSQEGSSGLQVEGAHLCTGLLIICAYDVDKEDSSSSYLFISLKDLSVKQWYEKAAPFGW